MRHVSINTCKVFVCRVEIYQVFPNVKDILKCKTYIDRGRDATCVVSIVSTFSKSKIESNMQ